MHINFGHHTVNNNKSSDYKLLLQNKVGTSALSFSVGTLIGRLCCSSDNSATTTTTTRLPLIKIIIVASIAVISVAGIVASEIAFGKFI